MLNHVLYYQPYAGEEPYLFLRYDRADRKTAAQLINHLIERQFRTCYSEHSPKDMSDNEWLANRILHGELSLFLISRDSLDSLEFRNCINFALSRKKKVFCVYLDDDKPGYGMDMQLANVPGVKLSDYANVAALCEDMLKSGFFLQDMRSDSAKVPIQNNRVKRIAMVSIAAILVIFIAVAVPMALYRIRYENSIAGQINKLTEAGYLDISGEAASTIELLRKSITVLVARDMGLTDIEALAFVTCEELDISENANVGTLEPLLENEHLKTVRVTQDMYPAIVRLNNRNAFRIVITG